MKREINIAHVHLETSLTVKEESPQLLIIENPKEFYRMVSTLDQQIDGGDGEFVFSAGGNIIAPGKVGVMVGDIFHFDLNDKKVLSLLYKNVEKQVYENYFADLQELNSKLVAFLEGVSGGGQFTVAYDEPCLQDYLKIVGYHFEKTYDTLIEKLICYVNTLVELKGCEFVIFVNLKSVLDDEDLAQLYHHCQLEKIGVLLLESTCARPLLANERAVVVTDDLCEIVENGSGL